MVVIVACFYKFLCSDQSHSWLQSSKLFVNIQWFPLTSLEKGKFARTMHRDEDSGEVGEKRKKLI